MTNNLVINNNGAATTTSLKVAEVFNKQHKHILEKIEKLLLEINEPNFGLVKTNMFMETSYIDIKGEKRPCYNISRDGFTLLAMGFTGKKALEFKLKYIEAFNLMEAKLKGEAQRLRTATYQRLSDIINNCIDARMEKWEKTFLKPKYDFEIRDLSTAEQIKLSVVDDMNNAIQNYGKVCEIIGQMTGVLTLKKMLPQNLYEQVSKCIAERGIGI